MKKNLGRQRLSCPLRYFAVVAGVIAVQTVNRDPPFGYALPTLPPSRAPIKLDWARVASLLADVEGTRYANYRIAWCGTLFWLPPVTPLPPPAVRIAARR